MNTNTKTNDELVGYTLSHDRVTTPGKFEGLHASFVLAYNAYLAGESDNEFIEHNGTGFDVEVSHTTIEWNGWPRVVSFWEDDHGFVMPFDDDEFFSFDDVQSISVGTRSALSDDSWADGARRFALGKVIDHLTAGGAKATLAFQTGFGDLAGDIYECSKSWDWSNGHLFWVLARDSAVTFTDDPGIALEYAKTGGFPFVREYRVERIVSAHTYEWTLAYGDVMNEQYFKDIKPWYNELMLAIIKSDDI